MLRIDIQSIRPGVDISLVSILSRLRAFFGVVMEDALIKIESDATWEEWTEAGRTLAKIDNTLQWHWGEWWNYGHKKWDRKAEEFIKTLPIKRKTLQNYGSVTKLIKPSLRKEGLSFTHHALLSVKPPEEQKQWLKRAETNKWPVSQLRKAIQEEQKAESPPLPKGKFNVIYADPPWKYSDTCETGGVQSGGAVTHYHVMSIDELCKLPVKQHVGDNAVLFLWVTSPLFDECWPVIRAWGFKYKASFVWDKVKHNMGHYNSVRHELLLICTRGSMLPESKTLHDSVVSIERSDKHSEKPEYFRELIEKMYPSGKYLELFGRKKVKGWTWYGNDPELLR